MIAQLDFPIPMLPPIVIVIMCQVLICLWMLWLIRRHHRMPRFWQVLQTEMADSLHHPHEESRELDKLLEKLEALTLKPYETERLKTLLNEKANDPTETKDERNRAEFLLFAMREVVKERIMAGV